MRAVQIASLLTVLLLAGGRSFAQVPPGDKTAPTPDYSRPTLVKILSNMPEEPERDRGTRFHFGSVEFRALGTRWRVAYLPIMMPFSGSVNYGRGMGANFPNPFVLTGTQLPYTARSWQDRRAMSGELRRIERTEREREREKVKATIKVNPQ